MKKTLTLVLLSFYCYGLIAQSFTTKGNSFWLAYMENIDLAFNGDPFFAVYVFSEESGSGVLSAPATGFTSSFSYIANEVQEVLLPAAIFYDEGSEDVENFGLRIDMDTEGYAFTLHYRIYFSEASSLLPEEALGSEYIVTAVLDANNDSNSPSSFVVVATEDNTELTITPSSLTLALRPAGAPFSITLNEGQSYQVQSLGDLSGTFVSSDNGEKIAVFGGAKRANVGCPNAADSHCYDQLLPVDAASTSYPLIPFGGHTASVFKIMATEDNTEVMFNQTYMGTLNKGEYLETLVNNPKMLETSQPVLAVQLNPSQECIPGSLGDPNMLHLASSEMRGYHLPIQHFDIFGPGGNNTQHFITLFTETAFTSDVLLNGNAIGDQFVEFPNNESYSYAQIEMTTGDHLVESEHGVLAYAYGFGEYDAYTYHLGYESPQQVSSINPAGKGGLLLSPNPAVDYIGLHNSSDQLIEEIRLLNGMGQVVAERATLTGRGVLHLTREGLPGGLYYVQYRSGQQYFLEKVLLK